MYPVPKRLEAEIEQIFAATDPYETVSCLADDEVLIGLIQEFAESTRTCCAATVIAPRISGLPAVVTDAWTARYLVPPSWPNIVIGEGTTDKADEEYRNSFVPAYGLLVGGGTEVTVDGRSAFFFHMTDQVTGIDIQIRKNGAATDETYLVCDGEGKLISSIDEAAVTGILASLAGENLEDYAELKHTAQCAALIKTIGDKYGMSHEEYRLTAELSSSISEGDAKVFGAIIYAHDERPAGSSVSYLVERLLKYPELDADVILRMQATYFAERENGLADPIERPYLSKTIATPSGYEITDVNIEEQLLGTTRNLPIDHNTLEPITDTLQEVVASVVDNFALAPRQTQQ